MPFQRNSREPAEPANRPMKGHHDADGPRPRKRKGTGKVDRTPTALRLVWKGRERSTVELSDELPTAVPDEPVLLIAQLADELVLRMLDEEPLRARLAVYDLARLEKINAVRSSVFVYFEWFLRDAYGVKLVPAPAFTQGLVARGIISLGMG